jgi:hypothetical protein
MMDENLYNLNIQYLLVAQNLILAEGDHKAMFCLGLSPEAVTELKKMTIKQLKQLARSDLMLFTPRFNPSNWEVFLQSDKSDSDSFEAIARHLLMFLPCTEHKS